ncbi:MAG TPA: VIT domain-containing protein [bacterium]|nr:VIT domain-containing protein [bacterium]
MPTMREGLLAALAGILTCSGPKVAVADEPPPTMPGSGCLQTVVDGDIVDFPLKHTHVDAHVSGPVARVEVTQTFQNPYTETIEAVYVFPLPHESAVSDFEMKIGSRTIRGLIDRREEARRIYENARDQGKVAALLEQERPNIFTQSVANILPGNEIDVTITYVETIGYEDGRWELVFPTIVGPRFNPPGSPNEIVPAGYPPDHPSLRSSVPDADRINPPFLHPSTRSGHDLSINVDWDAGIPIAKIESPTHRIVVRKSGSKGAEIALHPLDTVPNKDFVLRCTPKGDGPDTGVLAYHDGDQGYLSVILHPKLNLQAREVTAKEMIFVLDCSGSMSGEPMAAAKEVVRNALTHVNPEDTFQIINFSMSAKGLSPTPLPVTPQNVKRGLAYLDKLQGEGGTMMIEGIKAALDFPYDPHRLRIVMFLTDGYIGNEAEILAAVQSKIGDARLFSFGVGSSVNRYLLDGLAEEGRGEVQYVLPGTSAMETAKKFSERIRNPYLTDVQLVWRGVEVEDAVPARTPDLFGGKPLAIHARYERGGNAQLEVRGKIAGRPWSQRVSLDLPKRSGGNEAVGALWARSRIAELERDAYQGMTSSIEGEITELGLAHHLVTKFTSFVAVEERMTVSNGRPQLVRVPVEMPKGVSFEGVFGEDESAAGSSPPMSFPGNAMMKRMTSNQGTWDQTTSLGATHEEKAPTLGGGTRQDRSPPAAPQVSLPDASRSKVGQKEAGAGRKIVTISTDRNELRAGEGITLVVTIENQSRSSGEVPESLHLGDGLLRIRIIDSNWRESLIGPPAAGVPMPQPTSMKTLAAGQKRTYTIKLTAKEAAFLRTPGQYHIFVDGGVLGAAQSSNRILIRVK